ncbi:MAG TPA: ABC transporter ATP-binding protein [Sediminibacterium sp.]|nr:ABC transporter ATP-binding protein [Sediminibacterium sp.]
MAFLTVDGISKVEQGREIVRPISFTQERLQRIAIAGETGSGKSTLLKMVAGLIQPDSGVVLFEGERVLGPPERLLPGHPEIAYLSQHFELRNNYRIEELLAMANKLPQAEADMVYVICQIQHLLKRKTNELSGGEKQRIALAGLLTTSPGLLLLDEPFSNLDRVHKETIKSVIEDIGNKLHITCILVSHDAADTLSWADRIMIMRNGSLVQEGTPHQLYYHPVDEYTAALLGEYNLIDTNLYPAFINMLGESVAGKRVLLRPEQLSFGSVTDTSVAGTVQQVYFYGSYYMVHVLADGLPVKIRTSTYLFNPGEQVQLILKSIS